VNLITSSSAQALSGKGHVPGDKSISHRALLISALAAGETRISGLLEGEDVVATVGAIRALGSSVVRDDNGTWHIFGCGLGALTEPKNILDMGNSGTACRLLLGLLASHPVTATLTGDASLRTRPMERVMRPLRNFGASFVGAMGGCLPLTITGAAEAMPIEYKIPVASAQIKSAVLLAGLNAPGRTVVIEPVSTRDHTEQLLRHFGADIKVEDIKAGARCITISGETELLGCELHVPADFSSAAFLIVAALLVPGSKIHLSRVGLNPLRLGLVETLKEMGAAITELNVADDKGELVGDLAIKAAPLSGIEVPPERAPSMIDEYPILAVAAACASGTTVMRGISELRHKESDRLFSIAKGLAACGVKVEETEDSLTVHGAGKPPKGGVNIHADYDHRIAMAFLVLGMVSREPITVTGAATINTSFPSFVDVMNDLGADLQSK